LWLVYADYLEEQADPRAAFIRRCPVLPVPWQWVVDEGYALVSELRREMCPTHVLYGNPVMALACRSGSDDVLFGLPGEDRVALGRVW
jgi:hypothetical protein